MWSVQAMLALWMVATAIPHKIRYVDGTHAIETPRRGVSTG